MSNIISLKRSENLKTNGEIDTTLPPYITMLNCCKIADGNRPEEIIQSLNKFLNILRDFDFSCLNHVNDGKNDKSNDNEQVCELSVDSFINVLPSCRNDSSPSQRFDFVENSKIHSCPEKIEHQIGCEIMKRRKNKYLIKLKSKKISSKIKKNSKNYFAAMTLNSQDIKKCKMSLPSRKRKKNSKLPDENYENISHAKYIEAIPDSVTYSSPVRKVFKLMDTMTQVQIKNTPESVSPNPYLNGKNKNEKITAMEIKEDLIPKNINPYGKYDCTICGLPQNNYWKYLVHSKTHVQVLSGDPIQN